MLTEGHIFSVKTKDPANVADIKLGGQGIVITGLNVLRDQIKVGDFVFVVFGGDKPKDWDPGLVGLAHISSEPYTTSVDTGKNFRIEIDVDVYFQPSIKRGDLVTYPDTFDTIGIGPITKWEPNQAITAVGKKNAIGLIQAICDLRPDKAELIENHLTDDWPVVSRPVRRYVEATSNIGNPNETTIKEFRPNLRDEFEAWLVDGRTSTKTALENASNYIPSVDDALAEPTKQIWHGLREALYGEPSPVRIYQVASYAELMRHFGGLDSVFDRNCDHHEFDAERFDRCYEWANNPINHGSIRAAWRWYKKFIQWKDVQKSTSILKLISSGTQFWTYSPGEQACKWDEVVADEVVALSYEGIPDLRTLGDEEDIRSTFQRNWNSPFEKFPNHTRALADFRDKMKIGDYVFAKKGLSKFIGVGKVTGEYFFDEARAEYKHRRKIDWFKIEEHTIEEKAARKTLTDVTPWPDFVEKIWKAYFEEEPEKPKEPELPLNVDRLSIALKMFEAMRKENPKFHQAEDSAREWFKDFTEEKLKNNFEYFQSKMIWAGMVRAQIAKDYEHVDELAKLLGELKTNPQTVEYYVSADFRERLKTECPGMGRTTVFDMLMKMHPESYGAYNGMMKDSLVFLGLLPEKSGDKITPEIYRRVMGIYEAIRERMREMKIGLHPEGDYEPPDFLVINEFLWFISECKDLIKEKFMKLSEKKIEKKSRTGERTLGDAAKDPLMQRLMAALRTKPFAILAGHSGTGKSRMVRRLAYMTCNDEGLLAEAEKSNAPGNYCMVQVKPNWHDSTDLIGYYSELNGGAYHTTQFVEFVAKAYAYPETPFFVCLDEMNLAPVEHYFAEYLSAIESRDTKMGLTDALIPNTYEPNEVMPHELISESVKEFKAHGLTIPRNLFVVGTVNMDETTHQFSRKVLDRAMTILMDEVDFASMSSGVEPSDEQLLDPDGIKFFLNAAENVKFDDAALLTKLNAELANTPFVVAYRFAKEFALYKEAIKRLDASATEMTALDHMVLMKLLPRIHGEKEMVKHIFEGKDAKGGIKSVVGEGLSKAQMDSILARSDEYLTFWP